MISKFKIAEHFLFYSSRRVNRCGMCSKRQEDPKHITNTSPIFTINDALKWFTGDKG